MGKLAMEMSVGGGAAATESMKPKARGVLDAVLPSVWLVKLRFMRTKSRRLKLAASSEGHHNVGADSAPFLPKTVENCYKHGVPSPTKPTRMVYHVFSSSNAMDDLVQSTALTPGLTGLSLEEALFSSLNPDSGKLSLQEFGSQNNKMMTEAQGTVLADHHDTPTISTTSTSTPSASSIATTNSLSTSSMFSKSTYRSSLSSLRNWCKLLGDESLAVKGRDIPESLLPKPANRPPKRPPWFLGGCGSGPRNHRNTRHGSLDLDNDTAFLELDAKTGLESIEEGAGEVDQSCSWPKKSESWSTTYSPATWDMELTNVEVVKNQLVVKKKTTTSSRLDSSNILLQSNNKILPLKPTLGHLFSRGSSETESPRKVHPEVLAIEYPQEKIKDAAAAAAASAAAVAGPKTPTAAQRKSFSSLSSRESSFRKPWLNVRSASSEQVVGANEGRVDDEGDLSDSQSLLKANMLTPDRLRDGKTWREQQRRPKEGENNNTKLLMSLERFTLDSCTGTNDYFGDEQKEELEEELLFGRSNTMMLPEDIHNSPVFESFLESSAKAWGIDFPSRRLSDVCRASTASMISDKSRELHCVTVQSSATESTERIKPGRIMPLQGQDLQTRRGREVARIPGTTTNSSSSSARLSTSSPSKTRSSKSRSSQDQSQPPKRRSPSRKASPKPTISREDTDFKLQQDMMLIDPILHDDYHNNNGRRKSTSDRPRRSVSDRPRKSVSERPVEPQRSSKISDSSQKPKRSVAPAPPAPQMIMSPPRNSTQQRAGVLKESVAVVVESSYDPYNDFRESMIEMIIDQDIQETGDLEELLQCYLALNEAEFHPVIVDVFTDVWHELFENNMNGLTG